MKNFLHIDHKGSVKPPEKISVELNRHFSMPINVEWSEKEVGYEALFYCDSQEHIALYNKNGGLINYRINISPPVLPDNLKHLIDQGHELMNAVRSVLGDGDISYEVIARDQKLERYMLKFSSSGLECEKFVL